MVDEAIRSGALISTEGCLPSSLGARVRINDGKFTVTDGPFTEAKEVVGGFAIFNANSKEEAIQKAKEFLQVMGQGETELRQLFEAPQKVQENYETLAKLRAGSAAKA
jgi:hypothetical protein